MAKPLEDCVAVLFKAKVMKNPLCCAKVEETRIEVFGQKFQPLSIVRVERTNVDNSIPDESHFVQLHSQK